MKIRYERISEVKIKIPKDAKEGMRVPGYVFVDEELMPLLFLDDSLEQVANGAFLPGIQVASLAMPDIHYGYGLPIGGVVATDIEEGVVTPGGVGFDINCGVRLVRTNLTKKDVEPVIKQLIDNLYRDIPVGVGSRGSLKLSKQEFNEVFINGAKWAIKAGYGMEEDAAFCESNGAMPGANPSVISEHALSRGKDQLGTLGSGNHFMEVQVVEEIYDEKVAKVFGIFKDQITLMIHTGSRGLGHQICTDFLEVMGSGMKKYGIDMPDRQLACVPIKSKEGQDYIGAMASAANFAWANRQVLTHLARQTFQHVFKKSPEELGMKLIYDVAHNVVKTEIHKINGKEKKVAVHRKGATRAFPPGHKEIPEAYRSVGQPVIIPGDMGRASYLLVGTQRAMEESFGSTCHGAGRMLSRNAAVKMAKDRHIHKELEEKGIIARAPSKAALAEEMPEAYKDVNQVVEVVHKAGLSLKVARMKPLGVIKG